MSVERGRFSFQFYSQPSPSLHQPFTVSGRPLRRWADLGKFGMDTWKVPPAHPRLSSGWVFVCGIMGFKFRVARMFKTASKKITHACGALHRRITWAYTAVSAFKLSKYIFIYSKMDDVWVRWLVRRLLMVRAPGVSWLQTMRLRFNPWNCWIMIFWYTPRQNVANGIVYK